jgi:hypothetical protein
MLDERVARLVPQPMVAPDHAARVRRRPRRETLAGLRGPSVKEIATMRSLRLPCLAVLLCAAATAFAQAQPAPNGAPANVGPFPPQPGDDPSLFRTLPPEAYVKPSGTHPAAPPAASNANPPAAPVVVVVPDTHPAMQEQLERSRLEAEAARARMDQTPAPINGAFTGLTDERDR